MTETEHILEAENLNVFYGKKQALFDVSFSMKKGSFLGLAGESGCGKTTLARTIIGINRSYEGKLTVRANEIQMVFQDPYASLNPAKRIGWQMCEPLRLDKNRKWGKNEMDARVREVLRQVELEETLLERYPSQLSGGQRQRVAIGVALMRSPQMLLLDEPVSALDVTIQAQILKLLKRLHEELELSMLFISHDLRVIWQLCDEVLIMRAGRVVEAGKTAEVYRNPQDAYTKKLLESANIREK